MPDGPAARTRRQGRRGKPGLRLPGVRVFSSAADARRSRRPTDVLLLLVAVLALLPLTLAAPGPTHLDTTLTQLVHDLGGVWDWLWGVSYALVALWPLLLLLLAGLTRGRRGVVLDALVAAAVALVLAIVVGRLAGTDRSVSLGAVASTGPPQVYVAARLALATAVVVACSPHLAVPLRRIGRVVLLLGAISGVALGIAFPIGAAGGFAVGVVAGAVAHLLLGSPGGHPPPEQVAQTLAELGVHARDVRPSRVQVPGTVLLRAVGAADEPLAVRVYGRDAWDSQFLGSLWTAVVRRGERPHLGRSRRGQVEHEAVATLLAERAGVPVAPLVAVGQGVDGDAVLVTRAGGRPFAGLEPSELDDTHVVAGWRALTRLHDAGIAHGRVGLQRLLALDGGGAAITDLADAELAAPPDALAADRARLLVATATVVGRERALAAARAVLGDDGLIEVLPFLQPAVLDRATRRAVGTEAWDLEQLRTAAAEACGVQPPPLQQLRRVSLRSLAFAVLGTLLAYVLITWIAGVDFSAIAGEFASANWWWLSVALLLSPFVQVAYSFSTLGAASRPLPYGPVLMLQYGIQFIAVALPSTAARLALEVRFFGRFGMAAAAALAIGLLDSVSGLVVQVLLVALIALTALPGLTSQLPGSGASSASSDATSPSLFLVLIALLIVAALGAALLPWSRRRIRSLVPRARAVLTSQRAAARDALTVLRRPGKVAAMLAGNLGAQVVQAAMLGVCLLAFGAHAHFAQLVLVNTLVSLFAGLMPVPGGVGVAEAGYTACLQAIGVPSSIAISTALAFRLVTFYLPPLWGAVAMGWLRRRHYV